MIEPVLLSELEVARPATWHIVIERYQAVSEYLAISNSGVDDVDRFAQRLSLSRRMFYRLIERRRSLENGYLVPAPVAGRGKHLSKAQENVVSDAIAQRGTASSVAEVFATVAGLAASRQIDPPSQRMVIERFHRERARLPPAAKLPSQVGYVIDLSHTDICVKPADAACTFASMLALIDCRTARVQNILLACGTSFQSSAAQLTSGIKVSSDITATSGLLADPRLFQTLSDVIDARCRIPSRPIAAGSIIQAIFGQNIASVQLTRRSMKRPAAGMRGIDLMSARAIFDGIIRRSNLYLGDVPALN